MIGHGSRSETTFVENVKALRERQGMSQTELAKRAKMLGLGFHQPTIQRIERRERPVKLGEAFALAGILGSTLEAMMKDTSLSFAYERLVTQMTSCWAVVRFGDTQHDLVAQALRGHVNELEDAVAGYVAAAERFAVEQQPEVVDAARQMLGLLKSGLEKIAAAYREAEGLWSEVADPAGVVPATFHSEREGAGR